MRLRRLRVCRTSWLRLRSSYSFEIVLNRESFSASLSCSGSVPNCGRCPSFWLGGPPMPEPLPSPSAAAARTATSAAAAATAGRDGSGFDIGGKDNGREAGEEYARAVHDRRDHMRMRAFGPVMALAAALFAVSAARADDPPGAGKAPPAGAK